ncbi:MAG: SDR family oxidoreductase [Pseudomonadota bacterium]
MTTLKQIQGSHVLVTGANRGIGKALVEALLERGATKVYASSRDLANLAPFANDNDRVVPVELDVTDADSIAAAVSRIPQLDLLINNAGTATGMSYTAPESLAVAQNEMATHYFGTLLLSKALLAPLKQSANAGIINISSIAGIANFKQLGPYSASKAAVHFLTQGLRAELEADDISVLGVYPGPVDTRLAPSPDIPKSSTRDVAQAILDAYEEGQEDAYPDPFSQNIIALFAKDRKAVEKAFAA